MDYKQSLFEQENNKRIFLCDISIYNEFIK